MFEYTCKPGTALDGDHTNKTSAAVHFYVNCISSGEFEYPSLFPQCYEKVLCGSPPDQPVNGTRVWITGRK